MFTKYYSPLPDVEAYLDRIEAKKPAEVSKEYLDHLIYQHQINIPFENIDINLDHKPVSLSIDDLFDKVVNKGRGGICFELNALFCALLEAIGFEVFPCMAQVRLGVPVDVTPSLHRVNVVVIDGQYYYTDVGFGGPAPSMAVKLTEDEVFEGCGEKYKFSKNSADPKDTYWTLMMGIPTGDFIPAMQVNVSPVSPLDFIAPCHFVSSFEQKILTRFTDTLLLNIRLPEGSASLTDDLLKINVLGKMSELKGSSLDNEEVRKIFNL